MFNVVITDINENAYNFDCDYFVEGFDNSNKRQDLTLYKNNDIKNDFVDSFAALNDVEIAFITVFDEEKEIAKYEKYSKLATASMTCRKGTEDRPSNDSESLFQGVAIFRK